MLSCKEAFLLIVRFGIGHSSFSPSGVDWKAVEALALRQGLSAILVDGIEKLPETERPPKSVLLQWIGETLQGYEYRYESYQRAIAEMASWYNTHNLKMMVLKGFACGLNWPNPAHRPYGDIDIWLFGQQKEADALLSNEKGIRIDKTHHHHTVFYWRDFMVENHYDFINTHRHKSHEGLELLFKKLGEDDTYHIDLIGEKVYLPSPNLHALFLMRHMLNHFVSIGISIRQILDWAFFVERHTKEIDWNWLVGVVEKYHMLDFFNCINAICVEDLGFTPSFFPTAQFLPNMKDKVLNDIIDPEFPAEKPYGGIKQLLYKYRRWKGNIWKQELCYNESKWSSFCSGVLNLILKPSTK